ncbi:hypothetical protein Tco_0781418 [Tanacetum coccineum]
MRIASMVIYYSVLEDHTFELETYALSWKPCQGDSLNLPDHRIHKDGDGDALFQLKSSYARAMVELRVDVELKYTIVDECPKNIGSDVAKNLKNPSQAHRGCLVGPMMGFKRVKQVDRLVSKKSNANTSGNKLKDVESRKEVSNPNLFDVLNSVENDVDLGTNGGLQIWLVKRPILVDLRYGMWDLGGKPLEKVDYSGDHDSENEVKPVDNEMTSFLALKRVGFGTNSLLEQ